MRKLKIGLCALFVLVLVFLAGTQSFLSLSGNVEEKIPYDYDLSPYISLGDLESITVEAEDFTVCTEEEVDEAIFSILLSQADFVETAAPAARYYKVKFDFSIEKDGEILSEYSQSDYELIIGASTENEVEVALGEALIGVQAGEEKRVPYTYSDTLLGSPLAGEKVILCAVVKAVSFYELPEITDESVKELFDSRFETVARFRASVREQVLAEKELVYAQAVWLALCEQVRVRDYPAEELADYKALYIKTYEDMAAKYEMTLEKLLADYFYTDLDSFQEKAEEVAREKVKTDMIFIELSRTLNVTLTEEEYKEGALEYYQDEESDFGSFEEFEEYYTKENLEQNILWDKALKTLVNKILTK